MEKLEYRESNRNMLLFLITFKTLHSNVTNFSNERKREENTQKALLLYLVINENEAKICY